MVVISRFDFQKQRERETLAGTFALARAPAFENDDKYAGKRPPEV